MFDKDTLDLLDTYAGAGFSAYAVGGCVRDALMGRKAHDIDIATDALPSDTERIFAGCRTVKTGIKHGTVTLIYRKRAYEITVFRSESGYSDSRHPDSVRLGASLEEDLSRRDFTINAMAWDSRGTVDLFGGRADLEKGVIRAVGDPEKRFSEDALRILRAVRFASRFGFEVETATEKAMNENRDLLHRLSPERIFSELCGILTGEYADKALDRYRDILTTVIPELGRCSGCVPEGAYGDPSTDVYGHMLMTVKNIRPDITLRLAALLYETGRPLSGAGADTGYAAKSAAIAENVLSGLMAPRAVKERVCRLAQLSGLYPSEDIRTLRRRLSEYGPDLYSDLLELQRAASRDREGESERISSVISAAERVIKSGFPLSRGDLAIDGNDLIGLGARGTLIKEMLGSCLEKVIDGELPNEKDALLYAARTMLADAERQERK